VALEVERKKSSQLFMYQTLGSILNEADRMLSELGALYTEADFWGMFDHLKDTAFLRQIYDKHWSPRVTGEFLAMPK
jgi:hypothetical protein